MSSLVLVLTDNRLFAYQQKWQGDTLLIDDIPLEGDQVYFLRGVTQQSRSFSCKLIIDRSDEEFVLDTLHATKKTMSNKTLAVKCARHFGKNAFTVAMFSKNVASADKARVMCAGIENKNFLHTFMQSAKKIGLVFERVYSLAILIAYRCRQTHFASTTALVISSHDGLVWRYSLIQSGRLLMSRCVFIGESREPLKEVIAELESTKSYVQPLIGSSERLICLYAGPAMVDQRTLPGRLLESMSRRFRLFDSDDLYKAVISKSRFMLWRSGAYKSTYGKSDYRRYFWANTSIIGLMLVISVSAADIYVANQHQVEHQEKITALRNAWKEPKLAAGTGGSSEKLSILTLTDLRWLVSELLDNNFNGQAKALEYRFASVLSKHAAVVLTSISFENEERSNEINDIHKRTTVLTASFIVNADSVASDEVRGFYLAIEKANLRIVSESEASFPFNKKGQLGQVASNGREVQLSISVTLRADS